ncbi:MAG: hypothetical protein M3483_00135 [Gemmatimonadota bacterium]|nr:hypothetical protein [Gemmatimonadota bacterium]
MIDGNDSYESGRDVDFGPLAPLLDAIRAHPRVSLAAGVGAGVLIGALTARQEEDELKVRVARDSQLRIRLHPGVPAVAEEEDAYDGPGAAARAAERLREIARDAADSLRDVWDDAGEAIEGAIEDAEPLERLERLGSAFRDGAGRLASRLPHRRPRSRVERLRRAVRKAF